MAIKRIIFVLSCLFLAELARCASPADTSSNLGILSSKAEKKFRILGAFAHPGKSHFDVFRPLLEELGRRGHDVTVISYFPRDNRTSSPLPNYRDINLLTNEKEIYRDVIDLNIIHHSAFSIFQELFLLRAWGIEACQKGLYNSEVQRLIKSDEKFDLIITEAFNNDCFLGFVHRFKAPFIGLSSHQLMPWVQQRLMNDDNPSYVPSIFHGFGSEMTFYERMMNALVISIVKVLYEYDNNVPTQKIVEEVFGPGVPPLSEIARETALVLTNTHFSLHGSRPNLPNVIEIGGIHFKKNHQPLPNDLQRYLDDAREGVLYFSLGSMIKAATMPKEKLQTILNVLGSLPRKVIWKWETENLPNKPSNLLVRKWLPQAAILAHPNVKCYMAHGGLLGISEGIQAGIPMVVIPIFGDQFHNGAAAKFRGAAEVLKWEDFTEVNLRTALNRVFNDSSYGENARALSRAYQDRPVSPLETAVWWTEYAARGNGLKYLKNSAQKLSWYQYYLLDVISFLATIVLLGLYATYRLAKLLFGRQKQRGAAPRANGKLPSATARTKSE